MPAIGIGLTGKAYLPDAYAYERFLAGAGWHVDLADAAKLSPDNDINLYFLGLRPFWLRRANRAKIIHNYNSLSTGWLGKGRDLLKAALEQPPDGRILLSEVVASGLPFVHRRPFILRDMGVDRALLSPRPPENPAYDLVYCGTVANRAGIGDALSRLARMGLAILVVGDVPVAMRRELARAGKVDFAGRLSRAELPGVLRQARAGLNYTPDSHPFNIQTSTKTLEYCAAGLGVVSTRYKWAEGFFRERGSRCLWLDEVRSKQDFDTFTFPMTNVDDLEWTLVLQRAGLAGFLAQVLARS